jgi:hypothetical protein
MGYEFLFIVGLGVLFVLLNLFMIIFVEPWFALVTLTSVVGLGIIYVLGRKFSPFED